MDELRERLDRLAGRVTDERDAYERLRAARRRRDRRRRIGAGALALVIAVGGTVAAVSAIKGGSGTTGTTAGNEPPAVPYLWPENWARAGGETPADVQAKVDAGEAGLQWRTDPERVAEGFAKNVIGDLRLVLSRVSIGPDVPGLVYLLDPCSPGADCISDVQQYVWLRQPAREGSGGIWDVAGTWADTLDVGIGSQLDTPTDVLVPGSLFNMDLQLPDDQTVTVGFNTLSDCSRQWGVAQEGESPGLGDGPYTMTLPVPASPVAGCGTEAAGYVYAYTVPSLTVPIGDPFRESAGITAVTAMPFIYDLVPDAAASSRPTATSGTADHVVVFCDAEGIDIDGPVTAIAQPDGVHVTLENATDEQMLISFDRAGNGDGGDPGSTDLVVDSPPGTETVTCATTNKTIGATTFTVADREGVWTSPDLVGSTCSGGTVDYAQEPEGVADPVEAARSSLGDFVQEGDELRLAGYPEAKDTRIVILIRNGGPIASVELMAGSAGWFPSTTTKCD